MPAAKLFEPVHTTANYWLDGERGGGNSMVGGTASSYTITYDVQPVSIRDIRSDQSGFTLDKNGFAVVSAPTSFKGLAAYTDPVSLKGYTSDETCELLKRITGASRAHVISHSLRMHRPEDILEKVKGLAPDDVVPLLGPSQLVHIGRSTLHQSYNAARKALESTFDEEICERLKKTRWGIINVWRPVAGPVQRDPLAMCDARSVNGVDLREINQLLPRPNDPNNDKWSNIEFPNTVVASFWSSVYDVAHEWWYASGMTEDEVCLIKCYDSKLDGRARHALHTAFVDPEQDFTAPPRQSIEVRCLVFWEDEEAE